MVSGNYMEIKNHPSTDQFNRISEASSIINKNLESRGDEKIKFYTIKSPKNIEEIYQNDQKLIKSFNNLFQEVDLLRTINSTNAQLIDDKNREVEYWKKMAQQMEASKRNDESKFRDLEVENLKLKLNVSNLIERQKGVESRIRETRNGWKLYKEQVEREKRRYDNDKFELLERLKSKRNKTWRKDGNNNSPSNRNLYNDETSSEMIIQLLSEKELSNKNILKLVSFLKNLYNCLEKLKASDGNYPIDNSFIAKDSELDGINYTEIDILMEGLNKKFITLLEEIKAEPFGSDDTFRSKRISKEKKLEVEMLKSQLAELQYNYNKVVKTMEEWKKWKENIQS